MWLNTLYPQNSKFTSFCARIAEGIQSAAIGIENKQTRAQTI